jgi:hypothetical protein
MKTLKFTLFITGALMLFLVFGIFSLQAQIQFAGYVSQGEGIAGWNADGSGPEPAALGHLVPATGFGNQYYYGSSHDYITENPDHACAHFLPGSTGFPQFVQALAENGYTMNQVKIKYGLTTLGDDLEGIDWFFFDNYSYSNYYDVTFTFELNGQLLLEGFFDYANMYINTVSGNWHTESGYSPLYNVATDDIFIEIADAFLADLDGKEIKVHYESNYGQQFSGNGRDGAYYNVLNGILTTGNPELPFQGLNDDHEGFAGWDADGTGPEPYGNGHGTQMYYGASLDYDDIDPDTSACLGHFIEGAKGFFNTLIQLQYRGYEIGDLKLKLGLNSLGPDVFGEDWGTENGHPWSNYYNNHIVFELNEEPILMALMDTNKLVSYPSKWISETRIGKLYDISQNASAEAQFVAQSLLRDAGTHYLKLITDNIQFSGSYFTGNGRDGGFWEIEEGSIGGVHEQATFIAEGAVSGIWNPQGSPYFVDGHLTIENGQTLTIEPGVKVAVRGPYQFNVYGNVMAEGTEEENILFTHSNPNLMWDGFGYQGELGDTSALSIFSRCVFEHGHALGPNHENSGGMFAVKQHNKLEIYNCTFRHNIATIASGYPPSGGAIAIWNSSPLIQNCTFYDNAAEYGGAVFAYSNSAPIISNCLFHDNYADHGGAVSYYEYSDGVLINNTIADNSGEYGGALFFYWQSNPQVINNIIWGNSAVVGNQVYFNSIGPSYPGFYYNNIEGGQEGFYGGDSVEYLFNIDEDPAFIGESFEFPYSLQFGSPCMDRATPDTSAWYLPEYLPEYCICGSPRFFWDWLDLGAFEWAMSGIDNAKDQGPEPLTLYPNPVREQLFLNFTLEKGSKVSIEFYNITGALISRIDLGHLPAGEHLQNWNASGLPEGIYICRLNIGNNVLTAKWVKAN